MSCSGRTTGPAYVRRESTTATVIRRPIPTSSIISPKSDEAKGEVRAALAECPLRSESDRIVAPPRSTVLQRTKAAVSDLDARLGAAQQAGDLQPLNRAYKAYRLDCVARGTRAMPYNVALGR